MIDIVAIEIYMSSVLKFSWAPPILTEFNSAAFIQASCWKY